MFTGTWSGIRTRTSFFFSPFIIFIFAYMYIHCLCHLPGPTPLPPVLLFVLWFCWRENLRDKKDIVFLLVWDKDSYTGRFLALLPCTCKLQPTLVSFYQTFSLIPGPLPIVPSANLRLLYLLLNREHINHIQVLGFLFFPYFSRACSSLSLWLKDMDIFEWIITLPTRSSKGWVPTRGCIESNEPGNALKRFPSCKKNPWQLSWAHLLHIKYTSWGGLPWECNKIACAL
jgi:hypothetical protein